MLKRQFALALIAILTFTMAMPVSAQGPGVQPRSAGGLTLQVPLTLDKDGPNETTTAGTLTIKRFVGSAGQIRAEGVLTFATATQSFVTPVSVPVSATGGTAGVTIQQAVCEVLELTLGPLDLELAGLNVHLDTVHLVITADPSEGLLGQLLAGLLCGGTGGGGLGGLLGDIAANLQAIVNILNQIIAIIG